LFVVICVLNLILHASVKRGAVDRIVERRDDIETIDTLRARSRVGRGSS
jgi:hypothetical protein